MDEVGFIGDIHGSLGDLQEIVAKALALTDDLVFLGDYVDRGRQSSEVLDFLIALNEGPGVRCRFVAGNHDNQVLEAIDGDGFDGLLLMGGAATVRSYVDPPYRNVRAQFVDAIPERHVRFLRALVPRVSVGGAVGVHDRTKLPPTSDFVISGHHVQTSLRPAVDEQSAQIDTGCGTLPDGRLTCFFWPSRKWIQSSVLIEDVSA